MITIFFVRKSLYIQLVLKIPYCIFVRDYKNYEKLL